MRHSAAQKNDRRAGSGAAAWQPVDFFNGCDIAWKRCQNDDVSRYFASREELCSELGDIEKRHDGVFHQAARGGRDARSDTRVLFRFPLAPAPQSECRSNTSTRAPADGEAGDTSDPAIGHVPQREGAYRAGCARFQSMAAHWVPPESVQLATAGAAGQPGESTMQT